MQPVCVNESSPHLYKHAFTYMHLYTPADTHTQQTHLLVCAYDCEFQKQHGAYDDEDNNNDNNNNNTLDLLEYIHVQMDMSVSVLRTHFAGIVQIQHSSTSHFTAHSFR